MADTILWAIWGGWWQLFNLQNWHVIESTKINHVHLGQKVFICEKNAQKYAKRLNDLTPGTVIDILTRKNHPRGIKVKIKTPDGKIAIGRIVYFV